MSCLRYAREKDREKRERETVMTEAHSDDGKTQWWQKHTVMTETDSDDSNTQSSPLIPCKISQMAK